MVNLQELNTIPPSLPAHRAAYLLARLLPELDSKLDCGTTMLQGYCMALELWLKTEGFADVAKNIKTKWQEQKDAYQVQSEVQADVRAYTEGAGDIQQ